MQLICLVAVSFFCAFSRPVDPSYSAEPFFPDQSGWKILVEDVSLVPLHDSIGGSIRGYFDSFVGIVNSLLRGDEQTHNRLGVRRTSAFVNQMRQQISNLQLNVIDRTDGSLVLPRLKMNFHVPMMSNFESIQRIAQGLESAFHQRESATRQPSYGIILSPYHSSGADTGASELKSCEEWVLPEITKTQYMRKVKLPDIYLLTDCKKTSVDVPDRDAIVIRTKHTKKDIIKLEQFLQSEISPLLLKIIHPTMAQKQTRLERIIVQLIDEDPSSHEGRDGKARFYLLSRALSSSLLSIINPMLHELSFIYGGDIELLDDAIVWNDTIDLLSAPSAYLSLPNDAIDIERGEEELDVEQVVEATKVDDNTVSSENREKDYMPKKSVSVKKMSKFIQNHSSLDEGLEWFLFAPSSDHSPLTIHDKIHGSSGYSIVLSDLNTVGLSLVQIDDDSRRFDAAVRESEYIKSLSHSLIYLSGYIRELNGLQSQSRNDTYSTFSSKTTTVSYIGNSSHPHSIIFWELESVAQNHWYAVTQQVLEEIDAVLSLLNEHGNTLALPKHVADKINKATHFVRKSISLAEEGYPAMYATSTLFGALATIESVKADAEMFELPYFAPDHYLAVFSPLVLPLIMPMIFGLMREVKRYNELKRKKVT